MAHSPLIQDLCDSDLYKFSMGQVCFHQFPEVQAVYRYTNRAQEKGYRAGFVGEVREQIERMAELSLSGEMFEFFRQRCPWLKLTYLQWLRQYRFKPEQVALSQEGGELQVEVRGPWFETIYWEVPLLCIISELSGIDPATGAMIPRAADWAERITAKAEAMAAGGVHWIDFGTRRRFDFGTQDTVCERMKPFGPNFRGTSNPFLAMRHGINVFGTYAHELVMAMQALYGLQRSNELAMEHWVREYRGDLGIALTDTLTTDVFLRSFDKFYAKLFDGVRQDSGCPFALGEKYIAHYEKLGIDPCSKVVVFSDSLDTEKAIALARHFKDRIKTTMGIGTHLTNDVGHPAPNHVIKLVEVDCGNGPTPLLKLSDDMGKITGSDGLVADAMRMLNIQP
jgi:nicotinate phosphoribosyltransferase